MQKYHPRAKRSSNGSKGLKPFLAFCLSLPPLLNLFSQKPKTSFSHLKGCCKVRAMKRVNVVLTATLFIFMSVLPSCAPGAAGQRPVEIDQFAGSVSYYPHEAGATWQYLALGEPSDAPRFVTTVQGPTVVNGDLWVVTRAVGKGLDIAWYRQYRPDGVFLLREVRPGVEINYDPPLQEMPAENSLRVGATWNGETTVTVNFPEAKRPEDQTLVRKFNYIYTVVDERKGVNVPAGDFDTFVIDFVARVFDDEGNEQPCDGTGECKQTVWFTPNLGEVMTEDDYFLIDTNVRQGLPIP
jgi:hypothetical protein